MLKKILAISGKPGLYKLLSQGNNMLIVESLIDGRRMPSYNRDKVVSLGEIAIYTNDGGEKPLGEVLEAVKTRENGNSASIDPKSNEAELRGYMAQVLPEYDEERVRACDISKMLTWYNLLVKSGNTEFVEASAEDAEANGDKA